MTETEASAIAAAQPAPAAGDGRYAVTVDLTTANSHAAVVTLVGSGRRVLDLGCAGGHVAEVLTAAGNTVVGVDIDAQAVARAATVCERAIQADLDSFDPDVFEHDAFDVILAADVLEHLRDPVEALRRLTPLLTPNGFVVASVPNVAHASVRIALLQGSFPYGETGLLDRSHLRFFTRATLREAFADAGLAIIGLDALEKPFDRSEIQFDAGAVPAGVVDLLCEDPDALAYQYIVTAVPIPHDGPPVLAQQLARLGDELDAARAELARTQREADAQRAASTERANAFASECDELGRRATALASDLAAAATRETELRTLLHDAHISLAARDAQLAELETRLAAAAGDAAARRVSAEQHDALGALYEQASATVIAMASTRTWRVAQTWWRLKKQLFGHW